MKLFDIDKYKCLITDDNEMNDLSDLYYSLNEDKIKNESKIKLIEKSYFERKQQIINNKIMDIKYIIMYKISNEDYNILKKCIINDCANTMKKFNSLSEFKKDKDKNQEQINDYMKTLLEILNLCNLNLYEDNDIDNENDYERSIYVELLDNCKSVKDLLCNLLDEDFHTEDEDESEYDKLFRFDETCNKFYEIIPKYDTNKKVKLSV
jgi:hypothetical protein